MKIIEDNLEQKVPILVWANEIDSGSMEQALNLSRLPFVHKHVSLMPDVHQGYGMPIGGVIACKGFVVPNAVGVDIGCGMIAVRTDLSIYDVDESKLPEILTEVCRRIHEKVPVGFNVHKNEQDWEGWEDYLRFMEEEPEWLTHDVWNRVKKSLGTLGGGNHFIEIQREMNQSGTIWIMIHSGSRYLGKVIADFYHKMSKLQSDLEEGDPMKDIVGLKVDSFWGKSYLRDMNFALKFAQENRDQMLCEVKHAVVDVFGREHPVMFDDPINIHHNYASKETHFGEEVWVHRKGATSAKLGQKGIIPGSMGTPSYIVIGKGNPLSFESCSHGAGRKMGRMDATRRLDSEECELLMDGIVYDGFGKVRRGKLKGQKDLGESPLAYKDIDEVIENQRDLVKVVHKLVPIANVKG